MTAREERERILRILAAHMKRHHAAGDAAIVRALRDLRDEWRASDHRPPRQISNLPESEQAEALAADRRKSDRHQAAGTLPTPIPRGAQR
jgi:hypothetical protein